MSCRTWSEPSGSITRTCPFVELEPVEKKNENLKLIEKEKTERKQDMDNFLNGLINESKNKNKEKFRVKE